MKENRIAIRDPKAFYFNFGWPKDVDDYLKHKIEFIIKRNEPLAENKIKTEIERLFSNSIYVYYYFVSFWLKTVVMITKFFYKMISKLFIRL